MFNRFMQWFIPKIEQYLMKIGRFKLIHGLQDENDVYLIRTFLFQSKWFSVYIHRFLRSDQDDPHDHPFSFLGYVVKGGYTELRYLKSNLSTGFNKVCGYRNQGTWAFRKATDIHVVKVDRELTYKEKDQATLTIIFRGPMVREWGFWKGAHSFNPKWVVWHEYLNVPKTDVRE